MKYPQILTFLTIFFVSIGVTCQHTEIINTYRPGASQGAFSVGKNVVQIESGLTFGRLRHDIFNNKTKSTEFEYNFRAGLFKEQLEFSIQGSYLSNKVSELVGDQSSFTDKGFPSNVIGAKYLVYDPYKYQREKSENLYSWKENNSFQWKKLIPAVSAYVGANFSSSSSDFAFQNNPDTRATEQQADITPKVIIAAQNNWAYNWVFVANIVADRLTSEFPDFRFILTSTYNLNDKWSIFGEYEGANSKVYKDHLLRFGGSYLIYKDFAIDAHVLKNLKNTPSRFALNFGASYRLDYHKLQDYERIQTAEQRELDKTIEQIKKDIEEGYLDESVMTGKLDGKVDLEEYVDEEVEEEDFDEDFEDAEDVEVPKKRKWFQFWKGSGARKARRDAKRRSKEELNDSTSTTVSSKPVLGSGGRMSDFVDDEFIKSKQEDITPEERTEEELAEIEERNAKKKKKRRKKNEPRINPETGEPYPEPDYTGMSRKEIKAAKKQEKELRSFEDEIADLERDIEIEQSARDKKREQKRLEKEARKKNKKNKGRFNENSDFDSIDTPKDSNAKKENKNDSNFETEKSDKDQEKERLKREEQELKDLEAEIELLEKQAEDEEIGEKPKKKKKKKEKKKKSKKKKKKGKEDDLDDEEW
ncbi:transporter [Aquimarina agarilytica]|uniref:transporter n=1 Tax=Aquimarina agarilytica TaxID=1087449 RepID=UPI0002FB2EC5|nr:transporter [Aquimarina agarilytica]